MAAEPRWPDIRAVGNDPGPIPAGVLTVREEEVVLLRLQSLKYREIASQLGISDKSVCTLLARALKKLQAAHSHPFRVGCGRKREWGEMHCSDADLLAHLDGELPFGNGGAQPSGILLALPRRAARWKDKLSN